MLPGEWNHISESQAPALVWAVSNIPLCLRARGRWPGGQGWLYLPPALGSLAHSAPGQDGIQGAAPGHPPPEMRAAVPPRPLGPRPAMTITSASLSGFLWRSPPEQDLQMTREHARQGNVSSVAHVSVERRCLVLLPSLIFTPLFLICSPSPKLPLDRFAYRLKGRRTRWGAVVRYCSVLITPGRPLWYKRSWGLGIQDHFVIF